MSRSSRETSKPMNRVLLNNVDHAVRVAIRAGAEFGDGVNQIPIFPSEFEAAQRSFPIIFRPEGEGLQAHVLLGLDRDENLFLDGDRWTSGYVPAFQRRGPFSIAVSPGTAGDGEPAEPMIHIDLDDPRVGAEDGLPVFREHGGNAPLLNHMTGVLRTIYQGLETAPAIYAAWREAGLLRSMTLQISLDDDLTYDLPHQIGPLLKRPSCIPKEDPTIVVLGGGGSRIVAMLGALASIESRCPDFLSRTHTLVGTSAGAILSILLCCRFTITELQKQVLEFLCGLRGFNTAAWCFLMVVLH
ncbi:MAG: hypothetical protein EOO77_43470 [Oxalobacteraceae bacterium]|nr:MAG: hypothetical protein EOO77_43470 [Oxalobacteraceae bacterium]